MLSNLNPESSPSDLQKQCSRITSIKYESIAEQCRNFFLVSNVYYKTLVKIPLAQKTLASLLEKDLNDR